MKACIILILLSCLAACASVEQSASKAFDNANSALRSGDEKIWMEPTPAGQGQRVEDDSTDALP